MGAESLGGEKPARRPDGGLPIAGSGARAPCRESGQEALGLIRFTQPADRFGERALIPLRYKIQHIAADLADPAAPVLPAGIHRQIGAVSAIMEEATADPVSALPFGNYSGTLILLEI